MSSDVNFVEALLKLWPWVANLRTLLISPPERLTSWKTIVTTSITSRKMSRQMICCDLLPDNYQDKFQANYKLRQFITVSLPALGKEVLQIIRLRICGNYFGSLWLVSYRGIFRGRINLAMASMTMICNPVDPSPETENPGNAMLETNKNRLWGPPSTHVNSPPKICKFWQC